jgi:hypothetical protein
MGWVLLFAVIGAFMLLGVGLWVLIDAFLIPDWIREHNNRLATGLSY